MLIVYVQEAGGPNDALREALRGRDEFKGVYMEGRASARCGRQVACTRSRTRT